MHSTWTNNPNPEPPVMGSGFHNVMVDIETLGTGKDAAVITIGACAFSLDAPVEDDAFIGETFQCNIHPKHCEAAGMSIDMNTVLWWMTQPDEARQALASKNALSVTEALEGFTEFVKRCRATNRAGRLNFWANDPDFDGVILESAYRAVNMTQPWNYYETRSLRTIKMLGTRFLGEKEKWDLTREGTHHNAMDDAIHQARVVRYVLDKIGPYGERTQLRSECA